MCLSTCHSSDSKKDTGLIANYAKPFYTDNIKPKLADQLAKINIDIETDSAPINIDGVTAQVRRVIDGDTIDVFLDNEVQRVRYIGKYTVTIGAHEYLTIAICP